MKKTLALAFVLVFVAAPALAFHDGGVAHCNGCHTMHNSQDGALVDPDSPNGNPYLLIDATATDVCLSCHATRLGAVWGDDPLAPPPELGGGNFVFLQEDNLNDGHAGATNPIPGDAAGHNVIAPSKGVGADATLTTSPGGAYPSNVLSCTSCHDPHGNQDFRLLYGVGTVTAGNFPFAFPAPDATGLALFGAPESNSNHTAYRSGMSAWCGNCHGDFHNNGAKLIHPSGRAIGSLANTYNLYNGTDDLTGGTQATAYLAAVPFEGATNGTPGNTSGPVGSDQVSCISCHRAHATSGPDAGRWDFNVTFLAEDGLESGAYIIPNPYTVNQRSLCNKCHAQDVNQAPF